ncbi:MAG: hypothetical protein KatS3mg111_2550 [Pirellulaceae bacterium]|nr:MAG: hypothetical protein KatS3mg111_2550 [Pirellulaceae bacterium]
MQPDGFLSTPMVRSLLSAFAACPAFFITLAVAAFSLGCSSPSSSESAPSGGRSDSPDSVAEAPSPADSSIDASRPAGGADEQGSQATDVKLKLVDAQQLKEELAKFRGKIVVLDVWSTSCAPCLQEFPHLIAISRQYSPQVQCVSLNLDYIGLPSKPPESYLPTIKAVLEEFGASAVYHLVSAIADDQMRSELQISAIPAVFLIDRDGRIVDRFTDANASGEGVSYIRDILPRLEALRRGHDPPTDDDREGTPEGEHPAEA